MAKQKKKYKILKVDECFQCCRYFSYLEDFNTGEMDKFCLFAEKDIEDPYKIPKWCPLEDYKSGQ